MGKIAILAVLMLAGCAGAKPPSGQPSGAVLPQAAEQCQAQPELDWC